MLQMVWNCVYEGSSVVSLVKLIYCHDFWILCHNGASGLSWFSEFCSNVMMHYGILITVKHVLVSELCSTVELLYCNDFWIMLQCEDALWTLDDCENESWFLKFWCLYFWILFKCDHALLQFDDCQTCLAFWIFVDHCLHYGFFKSTAMKVWIRRDRGGHSESLSIITMRCMNLITGLDYILWELHYPSGAWCVLIRKSNLR